MKGLSPTQRTLRELRGQGRIVGTVERWNPYVGSHGIRQDLFGFIDLIALDRDRGIVGIQSCGQSYAAHERKILDSECTENVVEWLRCGGKLELWGWRKLLVKRGGKAMRWTPRVREFTLGDFDHKETTDGMPSKPESD